MANYHQLRKQMEQIKMKLYKIVKQVEETYISNGEEAVDFQQEQLDLWQTMYDLIEELDQLEIDAVTKILDKYEVIL